MSLSATTRPRTTVMDVLQHVHIEGFKSLRDVSLDVGQLTLLVGPNGAGKTNFIEAFELLGAIVRRQLELTVNLAGGASTLLHATTEPADRIRIETKFAQNGYEAVLLPSDDDGLVFEREQAKFQGFGHSSPYIEGLGSGHKESNLISASERGVKVAKWVHQRMSLWDVYHFHDTSRRSPIKQKGHIDDNEILKPDASNLAAFLYRLRETDRSTYDRIVSAIRLVAPFFDDFRLQPDRLNESRIQLEWIQRDSRAYFNGQALSDGTLRFICIATLLLQPEPPSLVLLDEPELGLHPYAIAQVASMMRSSECQIIASTQSVTLLDHMEINDVLIAEQVGGETTLTKPLVESLTTWLDEYGLGELWEKNLIGGQPVQR